MTDFSKLLAPFPKNKISWRAQTVTKDGDKALALAYIDARDVYERLDEVCGPECWQCKYTQENDRTYCSIGIWSESRKEWIWKSNAAGDTTVEKEKGAASDALKRAAVCWGIGRYLYDLESVWVPCESSDFKGKKQFRRFKADPWNFVRNAPPDPSDKPIDETRLGILREHIDQTETDISRFCTHFGINALKDLPLSRFEGAMEMLNKKAA